MARVTGFPCTNLIAMPAYKVALLKDSSTVEWMTVPSDADFSALLRKWLECEECDPAQISPQLTQWVPCRDDEADSRRAWSLVSKFDAATGVSIDTTELDIARLAQTLADDARVRENFTAAFM